MKKEIKMKRLKVYLLSISIAIATALSFGFADNYFSISKNLDIFSSVYKELNTYYVDEIKPGELIKTAIDNMLTSLDPYTNYIPESNIEDYRFMTTGQYGGIGALIHQDSIYVRISEPYEGFPAQKAGLMAGDILLEIDDKDATDRTTEEVSKLLKGQSLSEVKLKIKRPVNDSTFTTTFKRENIKIEDVPYYGMINDNTGYIKLSGFTNTASTEFKDAFKNLKKQGMEKLVFDLRDNGGGLLIEAVNIVNTLIPRGKVVVKTKGKREEWDATYATTKEPLDTEIPVVVLVNERSASASEIVAGCIQDYDRGVIVGKQTFGKGLVQQTRPLSYNAQLKVTVAKYYIPSGRCIQKIDYSNKNIEGFAEMVPDSMIHSFKTLVSQREVFDGKGIKPDIVTNDEKMSKIAITLIQKLLIFDYATDYRYRNKQVAKAGTFSLTDREYEAFKNFLEDKDYNYQTESERLLERLEEVAKKEMYYEGAEKEYEALEERIIKDKKDDLNKFKEEVKQLLENEIVSRYYYQSGRIAQSLSHDPDILKALEVFDEDNYKNILSGNY